MTLKANSFQKVPASLEIFHKRSWLLEQNDVMVSIAYKSSHNRKS